MVIDRLHIVQLIQQKTSLIVKEEKDGIERFCKDLTEDVTKIINYEKEKTIPLIKKKTSWAKSLLYIQKKI